MGPETNSREIYIFQQAPPRHIGYSNQRLLPLVAFLLETIQQARAMLHVYGHHLCNIRYPSEIHLKVKFRDISFVYNICLNYPCYGRTRFREIWV